MNIKSDRVGDKSHFNRNLENEVVYYFDDIVKSVRTSLKEGDKLFGHFKIVEFYPLFVVCKDDVTHLPTSFTYIDIWMHRMTGTYNYNDKRQDRKSGSRQFYPTSSG